MIELFPRGFHASGVAAGLKPSGALDIGILRSDDPASVAGLFTRNAVRAAPVRLSEARLAAGMARAIIVNAGNANACTGPQGAVDAAAMADQTAVALGVGAEEVLVASTGIIGVPMPMEQVRAGIDIVASAPHDPLAFASAIMTTDTRPKMASARVGEAVIWGVAKGAGMIAPELATMLVFIATDAAMDAAALDAALRRASNDSFNAISVDGCMSTNDCVLVMANGRAGAVEADAFEAALREICSSLASQIVADGEGATKVVRIDVEGAGDDGDARRAAVAVADSLLVRCAITGADPNWGRILAAVGAAGIALDPDAIDVWIGSEQVCAAGAVGPGDKSRAAAAMAGPEVSIRIAVGRGNGTATRWTNDLTAAYIHINAEYTT